MGSAVLSPTAVVGTVLEKTSDPVDMQGPKLHSVALIDVAQRYKCFEVVLVVICAQNCLREYCS